MARAFDVYLIPLSGAHAQASCSNSVTCTFSPPSGSTNQAGQETAHAVLISVTTNNVWVTFDGSTPSSTNGVTFIAGVNPWFIPVGSNCTIKCLATAVSTATVNVVWLA